MASELFGKAVKVKDVPSSPVMFVQDIVISGRYAECLWFVGGVGHEEPRTSTFPLNCLVLANTEK